MHFLSAFTAFNKQKKLFNPKSRILLAVSGGLDSVVLAELFYRQNIDFGIAHCNYNLRGKDSVLDEKFVRSLAKKLKVPFHTVSFDTKAISLKNKTGIQETARKLRYNWFEEVRKKFGYDFIATAHHLDDSIETFFINLIRGTGIKGLTGIPSKKGHVIRPLLFAKRKDIEEFAKEQNLTWREDVSNQTDIYLRNSIRHHLLPEFNKLQPDFENKMSGNFEMLEIASSAYSSWLKECKKLYLREKGENKFEVKLHAIRKKKDGVQILSSILHSLGLNNVSARSILEATQTGKKFYDTSSRLLVDRNTLLIEPNTTSSSQEISISEKDTEIILENSVIKLNISPLNKRSKIEYIPQVQLLDAAELRFPLLLRPWKAGDYFYPLGLGHRKKLSDYFTDKKISRFEKENYMVCLSAGDIVCILGLGIDDRFKVRNSTKKVLKIQFTQS
ncbi:MAG: tRNA lysidine(34) synthetase TilS [Bacteroidia bacterium]